MAKFSMSTATKVDSFEVKPRFPRLGGILKNCYIEKAEVSEDKTYVAFHIGTDEKTSFVSPEGEPIKCDAGATLNFRIYLPKPGDTDDVQEVERFNKEFRSFMGKHHHLYTLFMSNEDYEARRVAGKFDLEPAEILEAMAKGVNSQQTPKRVDLKVIINQKNWPAVPNYTPYWAPAGSELTSKLTFTAFDKAVPSEEEDGDSFGGSAAAATTAKAPATADDDLPF